MLRDLWSGTGGLDPANVPRTARKRALQTGPALVTLLSSQPGIGSEARAVSLLVRLRATFFRTHSIYRYRAMALIRYFRISGHDFAFFDLVYDVREIADVLFDNRLLD